MKDRIDKKKKPQLKDLKTFQPVHVEKKKHKTKHEREENSKEVAD